MADGFEQMIDTADTFFKELAADNTKPFFEANKTRYVDGIKKPAELFGNLVADDLSRSLGVPFGAKLFRIHRDVRFSKDKTPYNAHLHLLWANKSPARLAPSVFLGFSPSYFILGTGVMSPDKEALAALRALIDRRGAEIEAALAEAQVNVGAQLSDWGPEPLKRVPKPYDSDHPQAELLKRKSFVINAPIPQDWRSEGLLKSVNRAVNGLRPVFDLLAGAA